MIPTALRDSACRWLSKSGSLAAHESDLRCLASSQSRAEIIAFYVFLRDGSHRWESEWRAEFAAIFSLSDEDLPRVDDADRWSSILHTLISQGDCSKVRSFLEGIGAPRWDFSPVQAEPVLDVYPLDTPDDSGELPIVKARRIGLSDIADYLESLKESLAARYRERWHAAYDQTG